MAMTTGVCRVGGPGPQRFPSLQHSTSSGHFTHVSSGPPSLFFSGRTGKGPTAQSDVLASSFDGRSGLAVEQGGPLWGEQVRGLGVTLDPASPTPLSSPTGEGHLLSTLNPRLTPCLFLVGGPVVSPWDLPRSVTGFWAFSWALFLPPTLPRSYHFFTSQLAELPPDDVGLMMSLAC